MLVEIDINSKQCFGILPKKWVHTLRNGFLTENACLSFGLTCFHFHVICNFVTMKFAGKTHWVFTVRPFQNAVSVFGIWKHIHSSWSPGVKGNLDWVFKSGKWESAHGIGCWVAQLQWIVLWLGTGATRQKLELACIAVLVRKYLPTLLFQQCHGYLLLWDDIRDPTFLIVGNKK